MARARRQLAARVKGEREEYMGWRLIRMAWVAGAVSAGVACAPTSPVLLGAARPAISPAAVTIYSTAPPKFEEIAVLGASSRSLFNTGGVRSTDKVVGRMQAEAARLGANGLILEGFDQTQTGSIGTGLGSDSYSAHGTVSLGLGGFVGIFKTTGQGRAIYVPPM
jgi:hypothetical protein